MRGLNLRRPACSLVGRAGCRSSSARPPMRATSPTRHLKCPSTCRWEMPPSACASTSTGASKARRFACPIILRVCNISPPPAALQWGSTLSRCSGAHQTQRLRKCSSNLCSRWRDRNSGTSKWARPADPGNTPSGASPFEKNSTPPSMRHTARTLESILTRKQRLLPIIPNGPGHFSRS